MTITTVAKAHKGVYYFTTRKEAQEYAETKGYPTNRIIDYQRGCAIQLRISGPCAGPHD